MGLLRRKARPTARPAPPPGDWLDALQLAMHVDPAIRPKWDRRPSMPDEDDHPADDRPGRRFADRFPDRFPDRFTDDDRPDPIDEDLRPRPTDYAPIRLADEPAEPPSPPAEIRPPSAEKPWLTPISRSEPAPAPTVATNPAAAPIAVELLLQWVCRLSRLRRASRVADAPAGNPFAVSVVRGDAERYLAAVAAAGPVGARLRKPLTSVVDTLMLRGDLPLVGGRWQPLGPIPPESAYAAAVAEDLADPAGLIDGTWAVHHAALSLAADLVPDGPDLLADLDAKLRPAAAADAADRICPSAYAGVFESPIVRPVGRPLRAVAALGVGLLLLAVAAAVLLNVLYVRQMRSSIDTVEQALHTPAEEPRMARTDTNQR